ncbi:MAG TPA: glycosyltransferase family 4 protein [Acidimicrobiales bacterium]|nr:glycosyltransferase family 4 protein [Acidimicrobiales bacterium]
MRADGRSSAGPPTPPGSASLRVALVCPYSLSRPGGVQGQVMGLSRVLTQRGHSATVFAPIDDAADVPDGIDLVASGRSVAVPSNGSRAPVSLSPLAAARAVRALRRGRFDVVHVHEPFAPGLPYGLLVASDIPPLVATFHRSGASVFYSLLGPVAKLAARRFTVRCAVSEAARQTAAAAIGGEYVVLFNGVEVDRYRDADPWPKDGTTILFLGRHEERKGLRVLLEACGALTGAGEGAGAGDAVLWIAGDGPETEPLQRRFPESPKIRWLGVLPEEEKVRRLAAADVLCAPSLGGESFGMVLLEAMAANTLVVASDIDGYRDVAGGDAVLVPPGDARALARALASILAPGEGGGDAGRGDPGPARLAAASARAQEWSMNRLAERYETLYRSAAVRPGR